MALRNKEVALLLVDVGQHMAPLIDDVKRTLINFVESKAGRGGVLGPGAEAYRAQHAQHARAHPLACNPSPCPANGTPAPQILNKPGHEVAVVLFGTDGEHLVEGPGPA